jgi:hypothetical protein
MRAHTHTASNDYLRLGSLSNRELEKIMLRGDTPDADALAGWEFRGMNTPAWASIAGIKKFIKGFYRTTDETFFGYNIPTVQNALSEPWLPRPAGRIARLTQLLRPSAAGRATEEPKRFGFYSVTEVDPTSRDNAYLHALLLDYGRGGNAVYDPTVGLRDYVVRVERGSDELLLGKAYYAAGPARVNLTSYFVLERNKPTDFRR